MRTGREKRDALVEAGLTPDEGAYMLLAMGEISRVDVLPDEPIDRRPRLDARRQIGRGQVDDRRGVEVGVY